MPFPTPPLTGDSYVDGCFAFTFYELEENRMWQEMPDLADIPRIATTFSPATAAEKVQAALRSHPDYDFLYGWLGYVRAQAGDRDLERQAYLEGLQKSRSKVALCDYLGQWELDTGHLGEAVGWWLKACLLQFGSGASLRRILFFAWNELPQAWISRNLRDCCLLSATL